MSAVDPTAPPAGTDRPSGSTTGSSGVPRLQPLRLKVGRDLIGLGFLLVLAVTVVSVAFFDTAAEVSTVVGPVTTLVGTLVGTIFGVQATTQAQAVQGAQQQQSNVTTVAAALVNPGDPEALRQFGEILRRSQGDSSPDGNPVDGDF